MKRYDVSNITEAKSLPSKTGWEIMVKSKVKDLYQAELEKVTN